jgi:hypothetical protein
MSEEGLNQKQNLATKENPEKIKHFAKTLCLNFSFATSARKRCLQLGWVWMFCCRLPPISPLKGRHLAGTNKTFSTMVEVGDWQNFFGHWSLMGRQRWPQKSFKNFFQFSKNQIFTNFFDNHP